MLRLKNKDAYPPLVDLIPGLLIEGRGLPLEGGGGLLIGRGGLPPGRGGGGGVNCPVALWEGRPRCCVSP